MSLGGAYTDFTNFLKNIGRVYGDINLTGQIYRGVGSLFQPPPGDMLRLPNALGGGFHPSFIQGIPLPPGAENNSSPLPQDPVSQFEDTVVARFYRPFDKPIVTPPPQNTSTVDPTFDFAEGGEVLDKGIKPLFKAILKNGLEEGVADYLGIEEEDRSWASSIGDRYGLSPSKRDAARHVALGWLASKTDTPELAKVFADAREFRPIAGGPIVSRRMDLENNDIGYNLPAKNKNQAEIMILDLVEKGQVNTDDPSGYAAGGKVEQEPAFLEALERQRLREQAFDNEFAIEVAAQSNYATDIDPSIARYHGYRGLPGTEKLNVKGFYSNPDKTSLPVGAFDKPIRGFVTVPTEVGTVNTIHDAATPFVYAHEYRHKQFPELNETQLRIVDGMTALNEKQWLQSVDMFRDQYYRNSGVKMTPSEAQERLIDILEDKRRSRHYDELANLVFGAEWDREIKPSTKEGSQETREDYIESRLNTAYFVKKAKELKDLEKYNRNLPEQNQKRVEERQERESEAAVKNYAAGGGVGSLAPVARNMFNGSDIKRGVGAYIPYTRR